MGRPVRRGALEDERAEADHGSGRPPRGRRSVHERKSPGTSKYDAVTLERGLSHDPAFELWANLVHSLKSPISLKSFRKDIIVDVFNEAGQKVLSYLLFRCWVSEFQTLPALDAATAAVAIETIKLENEGWQRDESVTEPAET